MCIRHNFCLISFVGWSHRVKSDKNTMVQAHTVCVTGVLMVLFIILLPDITQESLLPLTEDTEQGRQVLSNNQTKNSRERSLREHFFAASPGPKPGWLESKSSGNHVHESKQLIPIYMWLHYAQWWVLLSAVLQQQEWLCEVTRLTEQCFEPNANFSKLMCSQQRLYIKQQERQRTGEICSHILLQTPAKPLLIALTTTGEQVKTAKHKFFLFLLTTKTTIIIIIMIINS